MTKGVSLLEELGKLNMPAAAQQGLIELYLKKANLADYMEKSYNINDFINEVKQELATNDAA